jgi:NitT/TauT family transport system ATP-binding protein
MSARPGRVSRIIDVPLARPRGLHTLADPLLHSLANEIREQVFSRGAH